MLEDWHCETSSSPKSTGTSSASSREEYSIKLKLIRLNSHHDRFCKSRRKACCFQQKQRIAFGNHYTSSPREPCKPMKIADARSSNPSFYRPLFWTAKKVTKKMSIFCAKNNLLDLKEHLGNIFFKSAWCYCDKSFSVFVHPICFFSLIMQISSK